MRHHVDVRLDLGEQARRLHALDDLLARDEAIEAVIGCSVSSSSGDGGDVAQEMRSLSRSSSIGLGIEHVDQRQVVAPPDLEVVEVVGGRDLDRAGALLRIGILVGDDRDAPADQRQDRACARPDAGSARRRGCTATAVSPSMVSGRVVATVMKVSARPSTGYLKCQSCPLVSTCCTSRSEMAVSSFGSQLTSRLSL